MLDVRLNRDARTVVYGLSSQDQGSWAEMGIAIQH
jgi:hypothetical protein